VTAPSASADPFGTAALREAVLTAWSASPTRLAEDAAAEADLARIGYRDRLLTELVANAADAAAAAGIDGRVRILADGDTLRVANTGAGLTAAGVRSLTALRVSPKGAGTGEVGRFGVGFRATCLAERVELRSVTGSIGFDAGRTRRAAREAGIDLPDDAPVPAQRLAWPVPEPPPAGFDTEVVVHLSGPAQAAELLAQAREQAPDLLLELPRIGTVEVAGTTFTLDLPDGPDGGTVTVLRNGEPLQTWLTAGEGATRWLVRLVDDPGLGPQLRPATGEVLRSPTPTAIGLTLPARLITDLPLTPDRRGLHPDADIDTAAAGYVELIRRAPDDQKHLLVPQPALAAGEVDAALHAAVTARLADGDWVPTAAGGQRSPVRTWLLRGLTPELAARLGEVLSPLAAPALSEPVSAVALLRLGARELSLAELADLLAGHEDPPGWWAGLYGELAALAVDPQAVAELGALPVPRTDGRIARGARGLAIVDGVTGPSADSGIDWLPAVHPDAYDPLLERLGAEHIPIDEVLSHPALRQRIEDPDSDHDELAALVLPLLAAAGEPVRVPSWLGALELPASDGQPRPADELLLPDSPLREVLVDDAPFGTVDERTVERYGPTALRRLGVGWAFSVLEEELPTAPDHDLPDEQEWFDALPVPPESLVAVRDLDLVDPGRWHRALELLAGDPDTAPLLADPHGYTGWWLRRYAELGGQPLRLLRSPDDPAWAGLFDVIDHPQAPALQALLAAAVPDDAGDAADWLAALADPDREIAPGVAARAHAALVRGRRDGRYAPADLEPPAGLRTLAGTVTGAGLVVDQPWWLPVLDPAVAVPVAGDGAAARDFADLVDADPVSEAGRALVLGDGQTVSPDSADALVWQLLTGRPADGPLVLHDDLQVALELPAGRSEHRVDWWCDAAGATHRRRPGTVGGEYG